MGSIRQTDTDKALRILHQCPSDLRKSEWRFAKALYQSESILITPIRGWGALAIMPSGNEVLTAGETWRIIGEDDPSELALRKLTDPTHPKTLKAFNCFIFGLDLHPNGRWHAAAGGGSPTEVRDPESGERLLLLPGEYHHGRFSGDGSHLLASPAEKIGISGARKITVWNVQSGLKVFDVEFPNIVVSGWRGFIS